MYVYQSRLCLKTLAARDLREPQFTYHSCKTCCLVDVVGASLAFEDPNTCHEDWGRHGDAIVCPARAEIGKAPGQSPGQVGQAWEGQALLRRLYK